MLTVEKAPQGSFYIIADDEDIELPMELQGSYTHLSSAKAAIDSYLRTTVKAKGVTRNAKRTLSS